MHEYSITQSIIQILSDIIKEHKIKKLKKINFELGPLAHIEPQSIEFYYGYLTQKNKVLKDAVLEFKKNKLRMECKDCSRKFIPENFENKCPYCLSKKIDIINSEDIKITSIEV